MAAQYELLKELLNSGTSLTFGQEVFYKFYQAFLLKDRWLQYIDGVGTTLLVTAIALALGVVLGSVVAMVRVTHDQQRPGHKNPVLGFFNTIIWAMITDVIDDSEVRNGIREDGTIYAVYSFARKLGQAFSSGLTGGLLTMIGYSAATAFDPEVTMGIFNISCIAPAIGFVAVALSLFFIYPLTKQKVEENVAALAQRHNK